MELPWGRAACSALGLALLCSALEAAPAGPRPRSAVGESCGGLSSRAVGRGLAGPAQGGLGR